MARPKKDDALERVQVYLSPATVKRLELTAFIKKEHFSKHLRETLEKKMREEANEDNYDK